jgi:hypothetical protein
MLRSARSAFALIALALASTEAGAQAGLLSAVRTVSMSATKVNTLSVTIVSGGTQTIPSIVDNAINGFPTPVRITTSWDLQPGTGSVRLLAYFTTPAQALANGTNFVTSARMQGRVQTAPTLPWQPNGWTAFTQNGNLGVGVNGGTLRLFRLAINGTNRRSSRTIDLQLRLNLTGQPALAAGTYSGTINVRAFTT